MDSNKYWYVLAAEESFGEDDEDSNDRDVGSLSREELEAEGESEGKDKEGFRANVAERKSRKGGDSDSSREKQSSS